MWKTVGRPERKLKVVSEEDNERGSQHLYDVVETANVVGPRWDAPPRNAAQFNDPYGE